MKNRIFIGVLAVFVITSICYARNIAWIKTEEPPVKLEEAIVIANEELKDNNYINYYCVAASLAKTFSSGDWVLKFYSKDGKEVWVNVASDKTVLISEDGFRY